MRKQTSSGAIESDEHLFERYLEGDDLAFMELFHRHTNRLFAYCHKIVGDREQACDILQDMWERLARFRNEGRESPRNITGFLIRSIRNRSLNEKARRRPDFYLEDLSEGQHPVTDHQDADERRELILAALERLPEDQRELLILFSYSGYSYEEIAAMHGEAVGTIRTRAWRARAKLGRIIATLIDLSDQ